MRFCMYCLPGATAAAVYRQLISKSLIQYEYLFPMPLHQTTMVLMTGGILLCRVWFKEFISLSSIASACRSFRRIIPALHGMVVFMVN